MKLRYNRFSIIPHTCSKCEKAFWLEPYKRYKIERFSMVGTIEYVTNICKECAISELKDEEVISELKGENKNEIYCACTDEEIAKSFVDDVEAVKDLLPRN